MQDLNMKLVIAIARAQAGLFSKIEKNVNGFNLNLSEFGVLEMLYHKGPQPVQKVAEKILVSSGTISYTIDKLEKKELVLRRQCDRDKRVIYVSLTEKGESLIKEIFPKHRDFLEDLFSGLEVGFKEDLLGKLMELRKALK